MTKLLKSSAILFSAGAVGGLATAIVIWAFGFLGISAMLGVSMAPPFAPAFIYPKVVWGGLWGLIYLLLERREEKLPFCLASFLAAIAPALVMLLVFFPFRMNKGFFGLEFGTLTPVLVFFFNYVWAATTLAFFRYITGSCGCHSDRQKKA